MQKRKQVGGTHYEEMPVQPFEIWDDFKGLTPYEACAIKYILRYPYKGTPIRDLRKCIDFLLCIKQRISYDNDFAYYGEDLEVRAYLARKINRSSVVLIITNILVQKYDLYVGTRKALIDEAIVECEILINDIEDGTIKIDNG